MADKLQQAYDGSFISNDHSIFVDRNFSDIEMHQQDGQLAALRIKLESTRANKDRVSVSLVFD
jgi:hypothetical protein